MRLVGSTGANPYACAAAAIAALWGPLHGGANEGVLQTLAEIGSVDRVPEILRRAKDKNDPFRLMGFGHRVYKSYDPRAKVLRQHCLIPISIAAYCCFYVSLAMRVPNIQCTGAALTMLYRRRPCRRLCGDPSSASSGAFALL